ncbi:hypothetical protein RND71_036993 [Anisodus tanguticus]|uniref:Uncharacterized protein n=1 Tax=Anisodus tanguticus TaxID=243964 RepID=A0AAE1V0C4_9SOLA|nr:hypothetical protein RND71_036993 [Anisodus tanguticus]
MSIQHPKFVKSDNKSHMRHFTFLNEYHNLLKGARAYRMIVSTRTIILKSLLNNSMRISRSSKLSKGNQFPTETHYEKADGGIVKEVNTGLRLLESQQPGIVSVTQVL